MASQRLRENHFENKFIDDLDNIDERKNYFTPVWDDLFSRGIKPGTLLDIGCGTGVFTSNAKVCANIKIVGVDGSLHALEIAKQRDFHQLTHVEDFNIDKIPLMDANYDFRICDFLQNQAWHV